MVNLCERCARLGRDCPIEPVAPVATCTQARPDDAKVIQSVQRTWRARWKDHPIRKPKT
jgi:hypothetical protein